MNFFAYPSAQDAASTHCRKAKKIFLLKAFPVFSASLSDPRLP
jgi:hypothetical protein